MTTLWEMAATIRAEAAATDVDKAKAKADYNVAEAQCEARTGDAEKSCKNGAKSQYDSMIASAKSKNDFAHQPNQ